MAFVIKVFNIIIGLFIICYVFYMRVLKIRMPRDLNMFNPVMQYGLILIACTWLLTSLYIIIKSILQIYNVNNNKGFLQEMISQLQDLIENALREVLNVIANLKKNSDEFIFSIAKRFYNFFGTRNEILLLLISYSIKTIIVFAFLFDVLFLFELKYFYKSLILLCIPISINILLYLLRDFTTNLKEAESFLSIKETSIDAVTGEPHYSFNIADEYLKDNLDLQYHIDYFIICSKLTGYLEVYDFLASYYNARFNIIIYGLYLSGWSYVLFINIMNIFYS